jgi:hypothetical protein
MMPLTDLIINSDLEFPEYPDEILDDDYGPDNSDDEEIEDE